MTEAIKAQTKAVYGGVSATAAQAKLAADVADLQKQAAANPKAVYTQDVVDQASAMITSK